MEAGRPKSTRVADIVACTHAVLEEAGVPEARLEAELLVAHCLGLTRTGLYLAADKTVDSRHLLLVDSLCERRRRREPLAYITGEREFWSLPFTVSPQVLIPRPETEFLVECVLARRNKTLRGACLDLCCGSGVIGIVLALELALPVTLADNSAGALRVARSNAARHGVDHLVRLVQADLGTCFRGGGPFSLVVSNPPYVSREAIDRTLDPEVALFEPKAALDGGADGLEVITRIRDQASRLLGGGGDLFLEIGADQGAAVAALFAESWRADDYERIAVYRDYAGRDRVVHLRRKTEG